jgi:hypothetical protein
MAAGEMSSAELKAFNVAWMGASLHHLCDGGVFGTFIDWRGYPTVIAAAQQLWLTPINLIVWAKTNGGMGSLYRSQLSCCHCSRRATRRTSTMSSSARAAAGALTYGPTQAPPPWAPRPAKLCGTTRRSNLSPCWKTRCTI